LEALKWVRAHGCLRDEGLRFQMMDCCAPAAEGGHLQVVQWLRENRCP
jgi:hypothetical protein